MDDAPDDEAPVFTRYLAEWRLTPDGAPIVTRGARLLPVLRGATPAMLKVAVAADERAGAALMDWWAGEGAARVLARDEDAILLEWAAGPRCLSVLAREGRDDEATRLICAAVARLHASRRTPPPTQMPPTFVPLTRWFHDLEPAAATHRGDLGAVLAVSAAAARTLLAAPRDMTVLHGDIHHANVLDFGARGWLAIDPKGLIGERGFDYANLFCNPDPAIATSPAIFDRRLAIVVDAAGLEHERLLLWVLAWAGLSAAWDIADGRPCETALEVARMAAARLNAPAGAPPRSPR